MNFHVGQKVKYVGPDFSEKGKAWGQIVPVPDAIYTVRAAGVVRIGGTEEAHILLNEIRNDPYPWSNGLCEMMMNSRFFRPVVERKTDISIFTEMLKPKQRELVNSRACLVGNPAHQERLPQGR